MYTEIEAARHLVMKAAWEKALSIKPSFTDVYFNLGITYLQLNQPAKALAILNRCKDSYYGNMSPRDKKQLDQLIRKAGG